MSSAYVVEAIDLSAGRDRTPIISTLANKVATVHAIQVPGAASLHFGQGGQPWPIVQGKEYEPCPPESDGIFVTNVAASGFMLLGISFEVGAVLVRGGDESLTRTGQIVWGKGLQAGSVNSGPVIQLFNPANSGKTIQLTQVRATSGSNGNIYLIFQRRQASNNGGGVLTLGAKRFLDRSLAPANPIVAVADAGISGIISGTTFDNLLFQTEFLNGALIPVTEAILIAIIAGGINAAVDFFPTGIFSRLPPGWAATLQHNLNGAGVTMNGSFIGTEGG